MQRSQSRGSAGRTGSDLLQIGAWIRFTLRTLVLGAHGVVVAWTGITTILIREGNFWPALAFGIIMAVVLTLFLGAWWCDRPEPSKASQTDRLNNAPPLRRSLGTPPRTASAVPNEFAVAEFFNDIRQEQSSRGNKESNLHVGLGLVGSETAVHV
jgi:hypothetical protein